MKILIPIIILSMFPMAFAMYADIPDSPEVHFAADIQQYGWIQEDYVVKLTAVDDRSAYCKCAPTISKLAGAEVNILIYPSWTDRYIIEELTGFTNNRGWVALNTFVTTHDYRPHDLYNMTISVAYGNSMDTQHFQFWTQEFGY